jgi:multicomponent Na+:H+ antiporter subunit F
MMITAAFVLLVVSTVLLIVRLIRGPSVADRVVALDAILVVVVSGLAVNAAQTGSTAFIDVAVVIGLLGFVGTGVASRFIERRGA